MKLKTPGKAGVAIRVVAVDPVAYVQAMRAEFIPKRLSAT